MVVLGVLYVIAVIVLLVLGSMRLTLRLFYRRYPGEDFHDWACWRHAYEEHARAKGWFWRRLSGVSREVASGS